MTTEPTTKERFKPEDHFRNLKGQQYLEVKWRICWFRDEHPKGVIDTNLVEHDPVEGRAVFRASVSYLDGQGASAYASGYGSETRKDFGDYLEKAECLELGAQILTRAGFKMFDQLTVGEDVLAYDPVSDRCVWTPLQLVTVHEQRDVIRMGGEWFEAIMTPKHSWATCGTWRSRVTGEYTRRLRKGTDLRTSDRIILSAPAPGGDGPLTADEAAVLGWLFTDGTVWDSGGFDPKIYQSKPQSVEKVRDLVGAVASEWVGQPTTRTFPTGQTYDCLPQHIFKLPARYGHDLLGKAGGITRSEDLPALIARLSQPARRAMLDAMMEADGDRKGYFGKIRKPGVMEAWQILCTLEGIAVGPRRNEDVFTVQKAKRRRYVSASELTFDHVGIRPVWCPTTAYGTWVTRLPNGQVTITGNTKSVGRALAMLGYGTAQAMELDEGERIVDSPVDAKKGKPAPAKEGRAPTPPTERTNPTSDLSEAATVLKYAARCAEVEEQKIPATEIPTARAAFRASQNWPARGDLKQWTSIELKAWGSHLVGMREAKEATSGTV